LRYAEALSLPDHFRCGIVRNAPQTDRSFRNRQRRSASARSAVGEVFLWQIEGLTTALSVEMFEPRGALSEFIRLVDGIP
jgi:hypothetical protein